MADTRMTLDFFPRNESIEVRVSKTGPEEGTAFIVRMVCDEVEISLWVEDLPGLVEFITSLNGAVAELMRDAKK